MNRRTVLIVLRVVLLGYLGACTALYVLQRGLIYYPHYTQVAIEHTDFVLHRDGVVLRGWQRNPGRARAALYFGGNGERIEYAAQSLAQALPEHSLYLLAYRGYGASEGSATEAALFADALALFDDVQRRHPDAPIAVIGRSLGSGVASYVAGQRPVERLVLVTPFDSLAAVAAQHYPLFPVNWLIKDRYDSVQHLASYTGPILVIRAGRDAIIPATRSERLLAAIQPRRVVTLASSGHNDLDQDPGYLPALTAFLVDRGQ